MGKRTIALVVVAVVGCDASHDRRAEVDGDSSGGPLPSDAPMTLTISDSEGSHSASGSIVAVDLFEGPGEVVAFNLSGNVGPPRDFGFGLQLSGDDMATLTSGQWLRKDFSRGVAYSSEETGEITRLLTGLRLTLPPGEPVIRLEVEMGSSLSSSPEADPDAVATLVGQPVVTCRDRSTGRIMEDPRWQSDFCMRALEDLHMAPIVEAVR